MAKDKNKYVKLSDAEKAEQINKRKATFKSQVTRIKQGQVPNYISASLKPSKNNSMRIHCNIDVIYEGAGPIKLKSQMIPRERKRELKAHNWLDSYEPGLQALAVLGTEENGKVTMGTVRNRKISIYDYMPKLTLPNVTCLYAIDEQQIILNMWDQEFVIYINKLLPKEKNRDHLIFTHKGEWYAENNGETLDI